MATNPFDRVNIGYDGLFGPKTMFYHISPAGSKLTESIEVPVMNVEKAEWVQLWTTVVVLVGFVLVVTQLIRSAAKRSPSPSEEKKVQ